MQAARLRSPAGCESDSSTSLVGHKPDRATSVPMRDLIGHRRDGAEHRVGGERRAAGEPIGQR